MNVRSVVSKFLICAVVSLPTCAPAAQPGANNPDLAQARSYVLTMDKLQKAAAASQAINKLLASNAALKKKADAVNDERQPIDQRAKAVDTNFPQLAALIHANGLATKEWMVITMAFVNDYMFVGMKRMGQFREYPPNSITPQNAAFVEQNFDALKALGQKMAPAD